MNKKLLLTSLILGVLVLSGCTQEIEKIGEIAQKSSQNLETVKIKGRDAKRIADINILNTVVKIYVLDKEKLPMLKDEKGSFRLFQLIKGSSDFSDFETEIKSSDKNFYVPTDPSDPERYYEYFSDGQIYIIKAVLEESNIQNCKETKPGFCELEIRGDLKSVLK
jgi:hypothetical protein